MNLVINEWLLDYSIPRSTKEEKDCFVRFFETFNQTESKIVIGRETPFVLKFYKYCKQFQYDTEYKKICAMLMGLLFMNSSRTIIIEKGEVKYFSEAELAKIPNDDWYLVNLARTVPDSTIITTDNRLITALSGINIVKIIHLSEYFQINKG